MNLVWYYRFRWLAGLLVLGVMQRFAPWARAQDPMWFRLDGLPEPRVGLELDASQETTTLNGTKSVYDSLFITPTVGLKGSGSVYHPNLLAFDFDGELGWGIDQMTTTSPGYRQSINESDVLERYLFEVNLLSEKPYNASFFASQDHTYRDYGSFDTFTVDSSRYGGRMNWNTDHFSINTDFGYSDESDTGLIDSSELRESYFNFVGTNKREFGQTTVTGQWNLYDNILDVGSITSQNESIGISDSETFGHRKQITAATGVSFSHADYAGEHTDEINATENITVNLTPNLDSFLLFNYQQNYLHPDSDSYAQGSGGLRHQLYESLTSTADVHGSRDENLAGGNSSTGDIYGVGLGENYVKRLQTWGHLTISGGIVADHLDDNSASGNDVFSAIAEVHQAYLPTSPQFRPVFLNRPNVVAGSIQVTSGGQMLVEGTDYQVLSSGQSTEIRLLEAPLPCMHLQSLLKTSDNLSITVNYQSDSAGNASYEALTSNFQIRLDLFGRLGLYGRFNWLENDAPPNVLTQTLTDLVGGVDYNWRWFRTGAEYEDYDSNYTQYQAWRFFQNLNFSLDQRSTLAFNLNETFYHYPQNGDQTTLQFATRYSVQLWSSLSCYVQGGASYEDVFNAHEVDGAAQAGFSWTRGKLSVRAGYEYNTESTKAGNYTEDRDKDRIFAYLKRTF